MTKRGPVRKGRVDVTWIRPPAPAKMIAKLALKERAKLPKSRRGGLDKAEAREAGVTSGVERAESIAAGELQPAEDVLAFFNRFAGTHATALSSGKNWGHSKVQQAWDLWGGDPMYEAASKAIRKKVER